MFVFKYPLVTSLLTVIGVTSLPNDYCHLSEQHVMCQNTGSSEICQRYEIMRTTVTDEERTQYLHDVNELRSKIAKGESGLLNLPTAANMERMVWNEELEKIAQADADRCDSEPLCSNCYNTLNMSTEAHADRYAISIPKIAYEGFRFEGLYLPKFLKNIEYLISEVDIKSYTLGNSYLRDKFSQIIRATMNQVGCGVTTLYNMVNTTSIDFYSCVRGPGFESSGEVYKIGLPCSQCPENTVCSETYEGLCEEPAPTTIDPNALTPTIPPTTKTEATTVAEPSETKPAFTVDFTTPDWEANVAINFTSTTITTAGPTSMVESSTDLVISSGDRLAGLSLWTITFLFFFVATLL